MIPLHDELTRLGFKQYIEMLKAMQRTNIFEELNTGNKEYCFGKIAGSWFAIYKKEVGVNLREKVFHSFRHTFANTLKQNGVEEALAAALLGHKHNTMSYGNYGSDYGVEKLYESLRCLNSV